MFTIYSILASTKDKISYQEDFLMKKQIVLSVLITAVVLFFSCNKNKDSGKTYSGDYVEDSSPVAAVESNSLKQGYALRINTSFLTLKGEDTGDAKTETQWSSGLTLGESVMVGNPRRLTYSGKEYDLVEVRLEDNSNGYAFPSQIAAGGRLAVVIDEKANLFSKPQTAKVTNTIVARKTVLVYYSESENESGSFVEVRGVDCESGNLIADRFMRLSSLSRNDYDIQAAILLQTALTMTGDKQTVAREALLTAALQDYPDSVFYNEIRQVLYPNQISFEDD